MRLIGRVLCKLGLHQRHKRFSGVTLCKRCRGAWA